MAAEKPKKEPPWNGVAFQAKGTAHGQAWRLLADGCVTPPSLEVFEHDLMIERRKNPGLTVEGMARRLVESYHQVKGFYPEP